MEKLRICMLGGCSLSYGDRTVDDSRQHARKPWLLLEYLVTFRNREIPLEELADLLIVSQVRVSTGTEIKVDVEPAQGAKCERCWKILPSVGKDGEHPGLCARCASVVRKLDVTL